jgi:hypothetical protein
MLLSAQWVQSPAARLPLEHRFCNHAVLQDLKGADGHAELLARLQII